MTDGGRWGATAGIVAELVLGTLAVAVACLAFGPYFAGTGWLPVTLGAVLVGTALAGAGVLWRWPAWTIAPVGLVGLYVYALLALQPWPPDPAAAGQDLLSGWDRMLTVALPADPAPPVLALPVTAGLVASYLVGVLVLRTSVVVTLCLPPLAVFVLALAVTASRQETQLVLTVALLACLALLVLVRANRPDPAAVVSRDVAAEHQRELELDRAVGGDAVSARRTSAVGRVLLGVPGVALVIVVAAVGALVLPLADGSDRADPRDAHEPDVSVTVGLSPLVELKPQLVGDPTPLYQVTVHGTPRTPVDRIRLAALDAFDGALWSQSGTFVLAGTQLPQPEVPSTASEEVTLEISVLTARSPYLPVVGRPLTLTGTSAAIDESSGSLVRADADDNLSGAVSYTLTAEVAGRAGIDTAAPPKAAPALLALPDEPTWVSSEARTAQADWVTPWTQLTSLEETLRKRSTNPDALPGHSYGAVERVLVGPDALPGNAEQYASAFAILARAMQYPSRVAVGYLLREDERVGDTYTVHSTDVHAWPEVLLDGYGWVAFDPTDTTNLADAQAPQDPDEPVLPQDAGAAQPAQPDTSQLDEATEVPGGTLAAVVRGSAYLVAGIVVVVLLALAGILVAKAVRRNRRRHRGTAAQQVAAAWRETSDRLRETGAPTPPTWTAIEQATWASRRDEPTVGPELLTLAQLHTAVVYAPTEPSAVVAAQAWELEQSVRTAIAHSLPLPVRWRAALDPRSLVDPQGRWARRSPAPPARPAQTEAPVGEPVTAGRSHEG
ncbi:DUF3488 and transglutaminase-like domain-containing protein [Cellulomonas xylanilytica]|uniref:Transglutaminase-like domain-containing protein n=1 Tax=Cellulomonas xylanilytica TaxID=233583 RepID=A0A510UYS7_9CELL|nr:transglutaminase domain-containing protein [Cellulomonas xylanilytica]GEK19824.1 hypothetical protein CXY01_03440 [Cellulomonas xylanilytica]